MSELPSQTPLYHAQHSDRYERQALIRQYEELTGARLIAVIDIIGPWSITYLEELLHDVYADEELHLMLETPGGDGEVAVRMARSAQARCSELTVIVPDRGSRKRGEVTRSPADLALCHADFRAIRCFLDPRSS